MVGLCTNTEREGRYNARQCYNQGTLSCPVMNQDVKVGTEAGKHIEGLGIMLVVDFVLGFVLIFNIICII